MRFASTRFVEELDGVLLGYTDLKLLRQDGVISFDAPHVHVRVGFRALLFAPAVGQSLGEHASRPFAAKSCAAN